MLPDHTTGHKISLLKNVIISTKLKMSNFYELATAAEKQRLTKDTDGNASFTNSFRHNSESKRNSQISPPNSSPKHAYTKCQRVIINMGNGRTKQDHRCTTDCLNKYPIHHAARMGKFKILKKLLDQYSNPENEDGENGGKLNVDSAHAPKKPVCCPLEQDECLGRTPLHYAAAAGNVEKGWLCTKLLLECSALMVEAEKRTEKLRKFVNATDYNHETALHLAASNEATKIVRELLYNQADLDIKTLDGRCALMEVYKKTPLAMNEALNQSISYVELCKRDMGLEEEDDSSKRRTSKNSDDIDFTQSYVNVCLNF